MDAKIWHCITWLWTVLQCLWLQRLQTCWLSLQPGEGIQPALCSCLWDTRDVCLTFANSRASPCHIAQKEYLQLQHFWFSALRLNLSARIVSISCEGKFPNFAILVGHVGALCFQLLSTLIISVNASLSVKVQSSNSCWCTSVWEYSRVLPCLQNASNLSATELNLAGFWDVVQVNI